MSDWDGQYIILTNAWAGPGWAKLLFHVWNSGDEVYY